MGAVRRHLFYQAEMKDLLSSDKQSVRLAGPLDFMRQEKGVKSVRIEDVNKLLRDYVRLTPITANSYGNQMLVKR